MVPFQLLDPEGTLADDPAAARVTPDLCRGLYRDMALGRQFDQQAYHLQRQGELGLWLMSLGQEAAQVGSIRGVRDEDWVFPSYREHVAALCRGIAPADLLAQWRGVRHSGWTPAEHRFHVYTLVLAAQLLHAVGFAMGIRRDGAQEVVLAYFGDGSSSEGEANEAFNWAATTSAPVVFFCQNNRWAISTSTERQLGAPLHERGPGFGLESRVVDGNDVLAVRAVTAEAAESVRAGGAPVLIEALTYRIAGHSTSDDARRYRSDVEVDEHRAADPIERLRRLMRARDWADEAWFAELSTEAEDYAADLRAACRAIADPGPDEMFAHVLADASPSLDAEHDEYRRFLASLDPPTEETA